DSSGAQVAASVEFGGVTQAGLTFADPVVSTPALPPNFSLHGAMIDIHTTALYTPPVVVCFFGIFAPSDRLLHFENNSWVDVTTLPSPNQLCGTVQSLSPFAAGSFSSTNTPPTLSFPGNITAEATGPTGAAVNYTASAHDAEDGSIVISCG